jgi:hypothetical protein
VVADELSSEGYKEESFALYRNIVEWGVGFAAAVWCGGTVLRADCVHVGWYRLCYRVVRNDGERFYMWALARAISLYRRVTNSHIHSLCSLVCITACCMSVATVSRYAYCLVA